MHNFEVTVQWSDRAQMWMSFVSNLNLGQAIGILDSDAANAARRCVEIYIKRMIPQEVVDSHAMHPLDARHSRPDMLDAA